MSPKHSVIKHRTTHKLTGQGQWDHDFSGEYDPATHEVVESGFEAEVPRWWAEGYGKWDAEAGRVVEMTPAEKQAADAEIEAADRTRDFNSNRALHAAFKVFLDEINALRATAGLEPLNAAEVRNRLKQEYDAL